MKTKNRAAASRGQSQECSPRPREAGAMHNLAKASGEDGESFHPKDNFGWQVFEHLAPR